MTSFNAPRRSPDTPLDPAWSAARRCLALQSACELSNWMRRWLITGLRTDYCARTETVIQIRSERVRNSARVGHISR